MSLQTALLAFEACVLKDPFDLQQTLSILKELGECCQAQKNSGEPIVPETPFHTLRIHHDGISYPLAHFILSAQTGSSSQTSLSSANAATLLEALFKYPVSPEQVNQDQCTVLHLALAFKQDEVTDFLLKLRLNPHRKDHRGLTPLHVACLQNNHHHVKALLEQGADPLNITFQGNNVLHFCAKSSNPDITHLFKNHKKLVNLQNQKGDIALQIAALHSNLEQVRCLVEMGAQLDVTSPNLGSPLLIAARIGHLEIVKYLYAQGASLRLPDHLGSTPLHKAATYGHLKVAEFLVQHGADLYLEDHQKKMPLDLATEYKCVDVMLFLKQCSQALNEHQELSFLFSKDAPPDLISEPAQTQSQISGGQISSRSSRKTL